MNRRPPIQHPLAGLFQRAAQSITTSLNHEAIRFYHGTIRNFLDFIGCHYPHVQSLQQLRRDPHVLAWFSYLRSRKPPLATITYNIHLYHLRHMLEELAWTEVPNILIWHANNLRSDFLRCGRVDNGLDL